MHGTWKTTGGGGPDLSGLIGPAIMLGVAAGVAFVIAEFAWLIITVAVVAVAVWLWLLHRKNVITERWSAAAMREHAIREAEAAIALAEQRRHEIEVARAGATVIQNVIDPAALLAAAFAPPPAPYRAEVIRAEVER